MGYHRLTRGRTVLGPVASLKEGASGVIFLQHATVSITNAQMLALRATPKSLVAAPGTGKALIFLGAELFFDYTGAYTETEDNLAVRYTNGSGAKASADFDSTGFVDAAADARGYIVPVSGLVVANAALVLHNIGDGELGGGNAANVVKVRVFYRTLTLLT